MVLLYNRLTLSSVSLARDHYLLTKPSTKAAAMEWLSFQWFWQKDVSAYANALFSKVSFDHECRFERDTTSPFPFPPKRLERCVDQCVIEIAELCFLLFESSWLNDMRLPRLSTAGFICFSLCVGAVPHRGCSGRRPDKRRWECCPDRYVIPTKTWIY